MRRKYSIRCEDPLKTQTYYMASGRHHDGNLILGDFSQSDC